MMKPIGKIIILLVIGLLACKPAPETMIPFLEGYWEIVEVKKNGKTIKTYTINNQVDYFEVNEDLSGFRKKVNPTLDGNFIVNDHQTAFELKTVGNALEIHYFHHAQPYFETVVKADEASLIIKNDDGFSYLYKPFITINPAK